MVNIGGLEHGDAGGAADGGDHRVALTLQQQAKLPAEAGFVIDDQDVQGEFIHRSALAN
jgi:hypothetical protein